MQIKYDNHPDEWRNILADSKKMERAETWFLDDRLDSWRHNRMRQMITPLIDLNLNKSWLTVGDGRFGSDAHFIIENGVKEVMATDVSDELLKLGYERGFINQYSAQNAESLNFEDGSFDYVYCKESYHHFPRPFVAIYEMLRVAKEAVVLTEPNDQYPSVFLTTIKKLLRRPADGHSFEAVGNYVYLISQREMEKLMLGIGLRFLAIAGLNDHYKDGVEDVPICGGTLRDRILKFKIKSTISFRNILCHIGLVKPNFITVILFKNEPTEQFKVKLRQAGFGVISLPKNPYAD